jgi:hypothetical protein
VNRRNFFRNAFGAAAAFAVPGIVKDIAPQIPVVRVDDELLRRWTQRQLYITPFLDMFSKPSGILVDTYTDTWKWEMPIPQK